VIQEAGIVLEYTVSATIVTMLFAVIIQRSALSAVRGFILAEENLAQQTRIAEISGEFSARIQSFIPRVIASRMSEHLNNGMSVVEASIEALKAKKKSVACLFTDIRGFTQGSKELDEFIIESVMPEVTACSNAIEDLSGIPRKIGDLIFAYFDDDSMHLNVLRALCAGIEVSKLNETMNLSSSQKPINRYILISAGEAMVGNFGGLDSSVEITALGTPVNFLSRVDDLTKSPEVAEGLQSGDLIVSETAKNLVDELGLSVPFELIDLDARAVSIRDFPEVKRLFKLTPTPEIDSLLNVVMSKVDQ
jgi:class 3 adenylate cyclase